MPKKGVDYVGKLTDKQRKQIIAEYVVGDGKVTQRELAQRYQVSQKTISKILTDKETTQKVSDKKKKNEISMLAFLDSRAEKAQQLIDKILDTLPQDFEKANMKSLDLSILYSFRNSKKMRIRILTVAISYLMTIVLIFCLTAFIPPNPYMRCSIEKNRYWG